MERIKNLGNYESETLEATAVVETEKSSIEAYDSLKKWVLHRLDIQSESEPDIDEIPY